MKASKVNFDAGSKLLFSEKLYLCAGARFVNYIFVLKIVSNRKLWSNLLSMFVRPLSQHYFNVTIEIYLLSNIG